MAIIRRKYSPWGCNRTRPLYRPRDSCNHTRPLDRTPISSMMTDGAMRDSPHTLWSEFHDPLHSRSLLAGSNVLQPISVPSQPGNQTMSVVGSPSNPGECPASITLHSFGGARRSEDEKASLTGVTPVWDADCITTYTFGRIATDATCTECQPSFVPPKSNVGSQR